MPTHTKQPPADDHKDDDKFRAGLRHGEPDPHRTVKDRDVSELNKAINEKAADPGTESVIPPPIADPVAMGYATPVGGAVIGGPAPVHDDEYLGETMPSTKTLSGDDQNRIEVLTGKRLQRDDEPVNKADYAQRQVDIAKAKPVVSHDEEVARERDNDPVRGVSAPAAPVSRDEAKAAEERATEQRKAAEQARRDQH